MSLWTRIWDAFEALSSGSSLTTVFETLTRPPEQTLAFTIAVIGLGAKMAKADGQVTRDEVVAFREVFKIDQADEADAARIFNLARQDVAGFDAYARTISKMFHDNEPVLEDLLEGLFYIAAADGVHHPLEDHFLEQVAEIFGVSAQEYNAIRSRAFPEQFQNPYVVLGVSPQDSLAEIKSKWQQIVRKSHPDQMMARGVPEEAINLATHRLVAVNEAWATIQKERGE